ncbi:MAG: GTPase Era [Chitinivibrionales bacterium]|nr:GTPase Era [Chitinivibrionales bacterium]MBD3397244.1 GTPase Era [Chitinivibrionales bacterium]
MRGYRARAPMDGPLELSRRGAHARLYSQRPDCAGAARRGHHQPCGHCRASGQRVLTRRAGILMNTQASELRSAFFALVGRPNSGKSTLLNAILEEELSIVTSVPQTTRRNLRGVYNAPGLQIVFVDTPGLHRGAHALNDVMYAQAARSIADGSIDVVCYVVDLSRAFGEEEDAVAGLVAGAGTQVIIVFNKADACPTPEARRAEFAARYPAFSDRPAITVSALDASAARAAFLSVAEPLAGPGPRYFPQEDLTDADMRFLAAELIRKRIIEATREEVPHAVCVEIISYKEQEDLHRIDAAIHVETTGQKGIVIGKQGSLIRRIQNQAQRDIARLAGARARLKCHVRVTPKWRDNRRFLREMGIERPG